MESFTVELFARIADITMEPAFFLQPLVINLYRMMTRF